MKLDHPNIKREQSFSPISPIRNVKKTKLQNSPKNLIKNSIKNKPNSNIKNKKILSNKIGSSSDLKSLDLYKTPEKKINSNTASSSISFNILNNINKENNQTDSPLLPFIITPSSLKLFNDTNLFGKY